jgi:hypothetical protein
MVGFLSWAQTNWSSAVGAVGILGSLWFTAAYFRQDSRTRHLSNILALSERHRVLWSEGHQRPELSRIFCANVDLRTTPVSVAEEEFLNLVFVHFEVGWRLARSIDANEVKTQRADVRGFFSLPLPHAVWEKTKGTRNPRFVRFIERALGKSPRVTASQTAVV